MAINAGQAHQIAALAARAGVFCAEALWIFFLPRYDVVRRVLDDGLLGDVHTVLADRERALAHEGLFNEAAEVARRIAAGDTLTPLRPLDATISALEVMDTLRARCGIVYPGEAETR